MLSFNKSKSEEVPVIGMKNSTHLKVYLKQRNYTLYILIHHFIEEHYQSVHFASFWLVMPHFGFPQWIWFLLPQFGSLCIILVLYRKLISWLWFVMLHWSSQSKKTLLMSTPKHLGAQIFRFTWVKLTINPPIRNCQSTESTLCCLLSPMRAHSKQSTNKNI